MFPLFSADWKRNVQVLRFAQDDNEAKPCHPERSEGPVRVESEQHLENPTTFREEPFIFGDGNSGKDML